MPSENASATINPRPRPGRKYFSLDEANRSLTYLGRIIEDVVQVYARVVDLRKRIEKPRREDLVETLEPQYEAAMDELSSLVDELHQAGVELKDFEKGLIDFPAVHNEREVCLCWQRGEKQINYWHEIDAGYAGRQAVALLESD
jgi:hypothetical protein